MNDAPLAGAASLSFQYGEFVNKVNCLLMIKKCEKLHASSMMFLTGV